MLVPPESAMLTRVLTIIFINLVPDVSLKLGELSFMHALSLWIIKIDASPVDVSRTRKQIVKLASNQVANAENTGGNIGTALESMLPRLQSDNQILKSLMIENTREWEFEKALMLSAVFARLAGFSIMLGKTGMTVGCMFIYVVIWLKGGLALSKKSPLKASDTGLMNVKKGLDKLENEKEEALHAIEDAVMMILARRR
jgi:hypothetical protein